MNSEQILALVEGSNKALLRRLIEASTDTIRDVYEASGDSVEDTIDRAEQRVFQISQAGQRKGFI